jgi:tetratricopeptide (TPR) repeat protein
MEKPPAPVKRVAQDYDKLWTAFVAGKDDARTLLEADKLLKKEKTLEPNVIILRAYIDMYRGNRAAAERQFEAVLANAPEDRIALRYLAELAFAYEDYPRAGAMYSRLLWVDESSKAEFEPKRQKSVLMTAENWLRLAALAEKEGRLADAERLYRDAGGRPAPIEPVASVPTPPPSDTEATRRLADAELEDLGRWGADIGRFRQMQGANTLTREEFAALVVRYFPELVEFRQTPRPATDIQNSWAAPEIGTVVGLGIADLQADQTFHPSQTVTRGDLCRSLAALAHIVGVFSWEVRPNTLPDVASDDPLLRDVQWALGSGLLVADKSGEFRAHAEVSGREAVNAVDRLASEARKKGITTPSFQQQP